MQRDRRYGSLKDRARKRRRNKWHRRFLIAAAGIAGILAAAYTLRLKDVANAADVKEGSQQTTESPAVTGSAEGEKENTGKKPEVPEITEITEPVEEKEEDAVPQEDEENGYDYARPVPESDGVGNEYFNDAVFIGNSRTEGLILNTGLSNAIAYTYKGLMVDTVFTKPVIYKDGEKLSVMEALKTTDFGKVYLMFGINETGWKYEEVFIRQYGKMIDEIKEINPEALIYIQEILPVTEEVSEAHSYVKNEKIDEYNTLLCKLAEEKQVYYVDTANAVAGSDGFLPEDAAVDGIHLKKSYCEKWLEYLKTHTVAGERRQFE